MPRQAGFRVQVLHMALSGFFWKKKKKHRTVPRTVQQSIPYTAVFADGTIETLPGTYTRAYRLEDVSFNAGDENMPPFTLKIDAEYVEEHLKEENKAADLRKYIL